MNKTLEWWGSRGYLETPTISFVLSTHNLSGAAMRVVDSLRQFANAEIIVVDDGSSHDHTRLLIDYLDGVNEFVLHANDLYDVVVLNRAISFARGTYVALIQDDDRHDDIRWVERAFDILDSDPQLAILGGRDRVTVIKGSRPKVEPRDGEFQYAQIVNAAPIWIRRDIFHRLGGFDMAFAPMLWHEGALCLEAWLGGYHVGWYESMVDQCAVLTSGRRALGKELRSASTAKNYKILIERFGDKLDDIQEIVERKQHERTRPGN